ncbi:MAG TPA: hypothetical protein VMS09_07285 [Paenibacillus sp.]|uniref:hypothetical protein n=1 Tax=Paenibacillus sp. TaxID=58172 RepID=UPI002CB5BE19|nr:hypothetical protein [Paenibacillus sp.]HUC91814.1 hypothetical protein [Paenibacillus sp.]
MMMNRINGWMEWLERRDPLLALRPGETWNASLDEEIAKLEAVDWPGKEEEALALKAGLLLWNGSLDRSHAISQQVETPWGSLWHGVMHRMEGDYGNAKYWFHMAGSLPVFEKLQKAVAEAIGCGPRAAGLPPSRVADSIAAIAEQREWHPFLFVDAVTAQERGQGGERTRSLLETIQHAELSMLVRHCAARVID